MNEKIEVLINEEELSARVTELAFDISSDYKDKEILLLCILKGSVIFMSDLAKKLPQNVELEFMDISSYQTGTVSSGTLTINKELDCSIKGKNVLIIEDIIDTGRTLSYLVKYLEEKEPSSLSICTLLDKPSRRIADVKVDYVGFSIPDAFVIGYGLDYEQKYRNLPYIGILNL